MGRIDRLFDGSNAHLLDPEQPPASQSELIKALGGTTLRDNFAMAAMGIARLQEQWREEKPVSAGRIAARAYAIADAMMAARDK